MKLQLRAYLAKILTLSEVAQTLIKFHLMIWVDSLKFFRKKSSYTKKNCVIASFNFTEPIGQYAAAVAEETRAEKLDLNTPALFLSDNNFTFNENFAQILSSIRAYSTTELHFEIGLFGSNLAQGYYNLIRLVLASNNIIFFIHSCHVQTWAQRYLLSQLIHVLNKKKALVVLSRNKDKETFKRYKFKGSILHYPIVYFSKDKIKAIHLNKKKYSSEDKKIHIALLGYFAIHKDWEIVIKALAQLDNHYVLHVIGSISPLGRKNFKRDPFLENFENAVSNSFDPQSMREKIDYKLGLSDSAFFEEMIKMDLIIASYFECEMSSSSAVAQALQLGIPLLASNIRAFSELKTDYAPQGLTLFQSGSWVDLLQKLEKFDFRKPVEGFPYSTFDLSQKIIEANLNR